jgi:hypothetical protein
MKETPITVAEVLSAIKYLKPNKPTGSDGIPPKFYKLFGDELAPILTELFNDFLISNAETELTHRRTNDF